MCVAITIIFSFYPEWFTRQKVEKVFVVFHCFVWGLSGLSTIIPLAMGTSPLPSPVLLVDLVISISWQCLCQMNFDGCGR
jgi:hypothetical protein